MGSNMWQKHELVPLKHPLDSLKPGQKNNQIVLAKPYETSQESICQPNLHMCHEKKPPTFHYTGWLKGILIMVYYNPYITG